MESIAHEKAQLEDELSALKKDETRLEGAYQEKTNMAWKGSAAVKVYNLEVWDDHIQKCPIHDKIARGICTYCFRCGNKAGIPAHYDAEQTKTELISSGNNIFTNQARLDSSLQRPIVAKEK